ncbi:MAG: sulfur oxidation c-type cytochrome SoxX [Phenylobacterium sp.]|nr:sulfur oxidation c-type cytochrome SoxX [Phenylobacterium sp.]
MKVPAATLTLLLLAAPASGAEPLRRFEVRGDAIEASLTGQRGDPDRGREIVGDRRRGLCLLCHEGPFPEPHLQGELAPDLRGVGARLTEGQIRLRIVDIKTLNPESLMPAYYRTDGLQRVGRTWRGQPVLSAEEIEDVVAYLATLRS